MVDLIDFNLVVLLQNLKLKIVEMPSDGDCMYGAIEHQLHIHHQRQLDVVSLRRATAKQLRTHKERYLPFMPSSQSDDKLMDEAEYERYCDQVEKTSCWGGNVELQALATHLGHEIQVVQANGPVITIKPTHGVKQLQEAKPLQLR